MCVYAYISYIYMIYMYILPLRNSWYTLKVKTSYAEENAQL